MDKNITDTYNYNNRKLSDQRVSWKTKQTIQWYKPQYDYLINKATSSDIMVDISSLYDAANGIVSDQSVFNYVLKPFGETNSNTLKSFKFPGSIRDTSIITPIIEKILGEYIRQMTDIIVIATNPDAENEYRKSLNDYFTKSIKQRVVNDMNDSGTDTGVESKPVEKPAELLDKFKQTWVSTRAEIGQEAIDYIQHATDSQYLYIRCFYDWIVGGRMFTYHDIKNDDIVKEYISPFEYYPIDNGEEFVEDHDEGVIIRDRSIEYIVATYRDLLSEEDYKYLEELQDNINSDGFIHVPVELVKDRSTGKFYPEFFENSDKSFVFNPDNTLIKEYITFFTSERTIKILTYTDEFNQVLTTEVDESYKLNKEQGDISIEKIYVAERLKGIRLGDEHLGIYFAPTRVIVQRNDINNKEESKHPINGKLKAFSTAYNHSVVKRLQPYDILYKIYNLQLERIISKEVNTGRITIIPIGLLKTDQISVEENIYYSAADGRIFVDETQPGFSNKVNGFKVIDSGLSKTIDEIRKVRDSIKVDAWDSIGWNRQRDGDIMASDGKGNTEQAIFRSNLSTILIFWIFDKFVEKDYQADLDHAKLAWLTEDPQISKGIYINSDKKTKFFKVNSRLFQESNFGVFAKERTTKDREIKQIQDLIFSASQNGELGIAVEAITTSNPEKLKGYVKKLEELSAQAAQQQAEVAKAAQEAETNKEFELKKLDTDSKIKVAEINSNTDLQEANIKRDTEVLKLDASKFNEKQKIVVQREQIAATERIAKYNALQQSKNRVSR